MHNFFYLCAVPNILTCTPPSEGIGVSWGVGGSERPKNLKTYMKLNWNFQSVGRVLEKIPSVRKVWIFFQNYSMCVALQKS